MVPSSNTPVHSSPVKDDQHIQYRQDIKLTWVENVGKALSSRFRKLPDIVSADPRWKKRIPPNTKRDQRIAAWISAVLKESIEKEDERYRQSREAGVRFLPTSPDILISRVLDSGTESPETSPGYFPYTDSTYSDHGSSHNDDNGALLFNLDQITMACLTALGKLQRATYTRKQEIETRHRLLEKEMRLGEEQQKVARQAVIIDQRLSELAAAEEEVTLAKMQLRAEEQSMECRETIFQKRKEAFAISRQQLLSKQAALDAREAQFHSEMAAFEDSVSRHNADMQHQSSDLQTREAQVALSLRSVSEREARVEEREAVLAREQEELRARQGAVATVNCKESDHINTTEGEGPGYQSAVRNEEADQGASYKHQQLEGKGADCSPQLRLLQLVFRDKEGYQELLKQKGVVAQSLLDLLQKTIDVPGISTNLRASICQTMARLSKNSSLCPSCLVIQGVTKLGKDPVAGGSFGDIFPGQFKGGTEQSLLCLKVVKLYLMSNMKRLLKNYLQEAIIWRQLRHPNVLPCLGLYYLDGTHQRVCLVSPWMENGNLVEFLRARARESVDHIQLMHDITSGLAHLHTQKVIHGDLKGVNVLVTRTHRACIADFGISRVADSQLFKSTSATCKGGTIRWSAPEIHNGGLSTRESDIYSVGCLYYEIVTGLSPFHEHRTDGAVILAVMRGERPSRPLDIISDDVWFLMNKCWAIDPSARPTAEELLTALPVGRCITPAEDWDLTPFSELSRNIGGCVQHRDALEFLEAVVEKQGMDNPVVNTHADGILDVV